MGGGGEGEAEWGRETLMPNWIDRGLSVLLILGGVGHTLGVIDYYRTQPDALFWSLTASLLIFLAGRNQPAAQPAAGRPWARLPPRPARWRVISWSRCASAS